MGEIFCLVGIMINNIGAFTMTKEELFYSETVRRTQEQYTSRQHFDTMATAVLGLGGVVLSAMVVATSNWSVIWAHSASLAVVIAFAILAIFTIINLWTREWQFQPSLLDLESNTNSTEYSRDKVLEWAARMMSKAITNNEKILYRKAWCLRISYTALAIEILSLGILVLSVSSIITICYLS